MTAFWYAVVLAAAFSVSCQAEDLSGPYVIGGVLVGTIGNAPVSAPITRSLYATFEDRGSITFASGAARQADIELLEAQSQGPRFSSVGYSFRYDLDCTGADVFSKVCSQRADENAPFKLLQVFIGARAPGMGTALTLYAKQRALAEQNGGSFTEGGANFYALKIAGHDAIMRCQPNGSTAVFSWKYLCDTHLLVSEQVYSRSTHYLYANYDANRDLSELRGQIGAILDELLR